MTKKICISGYYGFDNFGDETILKILTSNLKKFSPMPEITVFSSNPDKTAKNLEVKSVNSFKIFDVIKSLKECDYLISGGGSLLQDATSLKSLIYYLSVIIIAQFFKKETIIFAQGLGPLNNKFFAQITFFVLRHCKYITVRDENSYNLLKSHNIKAVICSDPVWNIEKTNSEKTDAAGIQLRDYKTLTDTFLNNLAECISKYYGNNEIWLLSLQNSIDLSVCEKLKEKIHKLNPQINIKIIENTDNNKVIEDISKLNTLIAMRYHANVIAVKNNVKTVPVNYDIKVKKLAEDFNIECLELNSTKEEMDDCFKKILNSNLKYDETKINSLKYNFKELEAEIN